MSKVLMDTHVFVWAQIDPDRVPQSAWAILEDTSFELFLSVASAWELTVKASLGKLRLPDGTSGFLSNGLREGGVQILPITLDHLHELERLPHHHRDPFDRMLVAQAIAEGMPLLSFDDALDAYDVERVGR